MFRFPCDHAFIPQNGTQRVNWKCFCHVKAFVCKYCLTLYQINILALFLCCRNSANELKGSVCSTGTIEKNIIYVWSASGSRVEKEVGNLDYQQKWSCESSPFELRLGWNQHEYVVWSKISLEAANGIKKACKMSSSKAVLRELHDNDLNIIREKAL